jgi:choline-sulfatase
MLSNHGLWGKANYYEESIRVPFVMSGPDVPKGIRSDELVGLIDLLPTICDYTEVNTPNNIDGMSLRPVIENKIESGDFRDYIITEYYGMASLTGPYITGKKGDSMRALCTRNCKYVNVHKYDNLYFDHLADPDEIKNEINNPVLKDEIERLSNILDTSFSWEKTIESINSDRQRYNEYFRSGLRTSTPNQYVLEDGRMFDAEASLYSVRWNPVDVRKGFIPQRYF